MREPKKDGGPSENKQGEKKTHTQRLKNEKTGKQNTA